MGNKGQLSLYVAFAGFLFLALGLSWVYLKDQRAFGGLNLPFLSFLQPTKTIDTRNWKEFKVDQNLRVYYPPDWLVVEGQYISQYSFTPGKHSNDIYNAISGQVITTQIQTSYANEDWFNRVYNAKKEDIIINEYQPNDQSLSKFTTVESVKTLKGDEFVVFKNLKFPNNLYAYLLLPGPQIYIFTLGNYDQTGQDYFHQIISTAKAN